MLSLLSLLTIISLIQLLVYIIIYIIALLFVRNFYTYLSLSRWSYKNHKEKGMARPAVAQILHYLTVNTAIGRYAIDTRFNRKPFIQAQALSLPRFICPI